MDIFGVVTLFYLPLIHGAEPIAHNDINLSYYVEPVGKLEYEELAQLLQVNSNNSAVPVQRTHVCFQDNSNKYRY